MRSAFRRLAFAVIDTVVYVVKLARDFQTMTRSLHLIRETVASRHPIELFCVYEPIIYSQISGSIQECLAWRGKKHGEERAPNWEPKLPSCSKLVAAC